MRAFSIITAAAGLALLFGASPASAECDTLAFEVNDYGKDGPTRDALALLDKHIVANMAKRGVTKYRVGEKSVKCSLFLDFIVFDEHTCIAQAPVCWGKDMGKVKAKVAPKAATQAKAPVPAKAQAAAKK